MSHNQLDEIAVQQLTIGKWSKLGYLDLSYNALDNRAMKALAEGQRPRLHELKLQGNAIDAVGVAILSETWPRLRSPPGKPLQFFCD